MSDYGWERLDLTIDEKTERFRATQIGKDLDPDAAQLIASYSDMFSLKPGESVFQQGDQSSFLCIISRGRVNIVRTDSDGSEKNIASVGPGYPLGELSLFDTEPRSASAVAGSAVEMLVLDAIGFDLLYEKYTRVWGKLIYPIVRSMSKRLRQTSGILADYLKY
jgi:CRP/FNR family transcriptional regulator, cyclic AMP receptor protein